jgi:cytochrome P450
MDARTMSDSPTLRIADEGRLPVTLGKMIEFAKDPIVAMRSLWAHHGELAAFQEDSQRLHFVFGPTWTKYVLSDSQRFHSSFFAIRGPRKSAQRRVTSGLLTMNGDQHKEQRRFVMGPFQKRAIAAYHDHVAGMSQDAIGGWKAGETRDISEDMTHYMLRLTSSILFGLDVPELAYQIGELTDRWVALNHKIGPAALSSSPDLIAGYDDLLKAAEELEAAVLEMIRMRRSGKLGNDVLSLLIRAHDEMGNVSDDQLIGHIVLLFGAAHLTSAHTLTWTLFLLAQHPRIMQELNEELQRDLAGGSPRQDQVEALPVLDRVLRESMRILPASAYSQRIAAEPVELGPFHLNPGSVVIFSQLVTHHIPDLYTQPETFNPDRWQTLAPSPYAYLPFGAGPRMCIGAALGMMQLKISLPTFLGRYKMNVVAGAEVNARVMSTMLFPSSVPMRIERNDGDFTNSHVTGNVHSLVNLPPVMPEVIRRAA